MNAEEKAIIDALEKATAAAFAFLRRQSGSAGDDDEWTRLPRAANSRKGDPGTRCPVSGWSRSTIVRNANIRKKSVKGSRFYSLADVRKLLTGKTSP